MKVYTLQDIFNDEEFLRGVYSDRNKAIKAAKCYPYDIIESIKHQKENTRYSLISEYILE